MSIKLMAQVWRYEFDHGQQAVLLAMADHADDDGENCYPSVPLLAWKTGYSERQVTRILQALTKKGVLIILAPSTNRRPTEYAIRLDKATAKSDFRKSRGDTVSPQSAVRGDATSPLGQSRGDICDARGDICDARGDIAVSPEPSSDPPIEPSSSSASVASPKHDGGDDDSVAEWKQLTSAMHRYGVTLSGYMIEQYQDMLSEYGLSAVLAGLESAAGNSKAGVLKYVRSCVVSAANGSGAGQLVNGSAPPAVKLVPVEDTV